MIRAFLLVLCMMLPLPLAAQELATLLADRIQIDPAGRITASGDVTVYYQGTELTASRISYDRTGEVLTIDGPIRVADPDGTVILADQAELDRDLTRGVLTSARLVLDRQLQLAAARISREGDRFIRLDRVVASSCEVCPSNPTPLWEIRARSVTHDAETQQLYFEGAQVRVAGIPVVWLPRLRLPGPGLDRATGFLLPDFVSSSELGTGVKIPYFIALGDHADLRFVPYASSRTSTLEFQARAFPPRGAFSARGAVTRDQLEGSRGYLFADFDYRLPRDFVLETQLELVSDPGYLFTYDYAQRDRLTNQISIGRVREKDLLQGSISEFRTLREDEIPIRDQLTDRYVDVTYRRIIPALSFGGRTELRIDAAALNRPSDLDILGRDVSRVGAALDWRRSWTLDPGILAAAELGYRVDLYNIGQDSRFDTNLVRTVPRAAVELRWPLQRFTAGGAREVLEPVIRIDWADSEGDVVPLEDSRVIEFDEANLVAPSRYPGIDGVEGGARAAAAVYWHHDEPDGWRADLAFGRVFAFDGELGFSEGTGLQGDRSEWVAAARYSWKDNFSLLSRSLFEDDFDFTLNETRIDWTFPRGRLTAAYISADPEPAEGRQTPLSELTAQGSWVLTDRWTANGGVRYDFDAGRAARAELGLDFRNECIDLGLSLSRRYASSTSVDPTTEFAVSLSLLGVGDGESTRAARRGCRG